MFLYLIAALYRVVYAAAHLAGAVGSIPEFVARWNTEPGPLYLIARGVSALAGTATVAVTYALGRRVADRETGMVAAAFLAGAFLHVRDSHFGATDVLLTFLASLSVLLVVRAHADRRPWSFAAAGLVGGLAASTKYGVLVLVVPAFVSQLTRAAEDGRWSLRRLVDARLLLFLGAFAVAALAATPYALLDSGQFVRDLTFELRHFREGHGAVKLGVGWWYHLTVSLWYGLGWPILIAGLAGIPWLIWKRRALGLLFWSFPIAYYASAGAGQTVFVRYMLPVVPFPCAGAAAVACGVIRLGAPGASQRARRALVALVAASMLAPSVVRVVQFDRLLARPDNRLLAARWLSDQIGRGEAIYQSGSGSGQLQWRGRPVTVEEWNYNEDAKRFVAQGHFTDRLPKWIVVQQSPVWYYSRTPPDIARLARESYDLVRVFAAMDAGARGQVFDQQDAFFLPLAGFEGVRRPGPSFVIYRIRSAQATPAPRL